MQQFDLSQIQGVLFDMDGTIVDNMPYHRQAWQEFCKRFDVQITPQEFKYKTSGKKNKEIFPALFNRPFSDEEIQKYAEEKETLYRKIYTPHVKEISGLTRLIKTLKQKGIKVAVATTAPEKNRNFVLQALGFIDTFDTIVGDEHVINGKPDPEIFLTAARQLGIAPEYCIVFEDAPAGIQAARNAGMRSIGLTTSHSTEELKGADMTIENYVELEIL